MIKNIQEDIDQIIYMGLYHHRDLIGSTNTFIRKY